MYYIARPYLQKRKTKKLWFQYASNTWAVWKWLFIDTQEKANFQGRVDTFHFEHKELQCLQGTWKYVFSKDTNQHIVSRA